MVVPVLTGEESWPLAVRGTVSEAGGGIILGVAEVEGTAPGGDCPGFVENRQ